MDTEPRWLIAARPMECCGGMRTAQQIGSDDPDDSGHVLTVEQHRMWCTVAQQQL